MYLVVCVRNNNNNNNNNAHTTKLSWRQGILNDGEYDICWECYWDYDTIAYSNELFKIKINCSKPLVISDISYMSLRPKLPSKVASFKTRAKHGF